MNANLSRMSPAVRRASTSNPLDRAAAGRLHLAAHVAGGHHLGLLGHSPAQFEPLADERLKAGPRAQGRQQGHLPVVERRAAGAFE
jgi:hypothetical protein